MPSSEGEVLVPRELILPTRVSGSKPLKKGALYISGTKLYYYDGSAEQAITSA